MPSFLDNFLDIFSDPLDEIVEIILGRKDGTIDDVKKYIKKLKAQGKSIDDLRSGRSIFRDAFCFGKYDIAFLCLNEKANPHLAATSESFSGETCIHNAIRDNSISKIRLLLWFDENYENVRSERKHEGTTIEHISRWEQRLKNDGHFFDVKSMIAKSLEDIRAVKMLREIAMKYLSENNFQQAADTYKKIGDIYYKQINIETFLKINIEKYKTSYFYESNCPATVKTKAQREMLFHEKVTELYHSKAYDHYIKSEDLYQKIPYPNDETKKQRLEVMEQLIQIGKYLNIDQDKRLFYSQETERLKDELGMIPIEQLQRYDSFAELEEIREDPIGRRKLRLKRRPRLVIKQYSLQLITPMIMDKNGSSLPQHPRETASIHS